MATQRGRSGDDILDGSGRRDSLSGANGDDHLYGRAGNDRIEGGRGNDYLSGGTGIDTLRGDGGNDRLYGDQGSDVLYGGSQRDALFGGTGADRLEGGAGKDVLLGGDGQDVLLGQAGDDRLLGGKGSDLLDGGAGRDDLRGGNGNDRLIFDADDSRIGGDGGSDTLVIEGTAVNLDFNNLHGLDLRGIDVIDMNGAGANTLMLDADDVLRASDYGVLRVMGGADDFVNSPTDVWTRNDAGSVDIDGQHYVRWDFGDATLFIDADVGLNNVTAGGDHFMMSETFTFAFETFVDLDVPLQVDLPPV